ncbi:MAG: PilZ domain-containing protein [Desulfobacteraceae bacterium]|nr:MAG: PilZ domain-containing protein [Desulfobacteraceae bacterium]
MVAVEQRAYKRFIYRAPVTYEYCNTNDYYVAVIHNHSMGGMCFETNYAIPKGVEVYIKMTNYSSDSSPPECRKRYHAQVRWCQERRDGGPATFRIGVNYFEPVLL